MLGSQGRMQEAAYTLCPTSTTQTRHTPTGLSFCWWHNVGIGIPFMRAASNTVVPAGTLTARPSMVNEISPARISAKAHSSRAPSLLHVLFHHIRKMLHHGNNRHRHNLPQTAYRRHLHGRRKLFQ